MKVFLVLTLIKSSVPNIGYFCSFILLACKFFKVILCISGTSRYTNIVYIGMYLAYLVLPYKERLMSTVCFFFSYFCWCCLRYFWHVRNLRHYSHLRAFSIIISGKFNSRYPSFFLAFFMWSVNCASLICQDIWYCHI